jgi:hypothetical protein
VQFCTNIITKRDARAGFLLSLREDKNSVSSSINTETQREKRKQKKNHTRSMGRNEIALTVLGTALLFTADAAQVTNTASSNTNNAPHAPSPRRAMPVNPRQRAQYLRSAQRKTTEEKRLILERAAKMKRQSSEKVERLAEQAKSQLGLKQRGKQEATAKVGSATTTSSSSSSSSSSSPTSHVKVHMHSAPKESELEEADEFDSFNPLDLFASLEGTKKTPFEKQTTSSGEVVENAVLSKKDKLSSVFATMLGSMMEVSRGVDESTGATASSNNSCVKATRNVAVTCFKEYSAISEDVKAGKLTAEESAEQMELLRETCADKSRVINTQCVKPIAEMCSSQVQEIKKECAKGIIGSEELTLNMALDSASAAAQQCATQASALLKSCMKQSKTLSPDLKELAMIDSKAEEKALEMKKEKEIQDKVNESMKDLSFSSSSSSSSATATKEVEPTLASQEEEEEEEEEYKVVKTTEEPISSVVSSETVVPQPGEQVDVVTTSEPEIVAEHHSSSLSTMKLPVVTEEVDEVEPAEVESTEAAVPTTATTQSHATVQTLSVPRPVTTTTTTSTTTIEEQQQQQPELTEEEQAVEEEADSGCAGALSKVTADCQLTYKQINDKVKSGELEEAAGKDQIAVAARQCVAKTMLATSSCVDKVQRRRLMSLAK